MATDINRVYIIGRLTKAPELRYTQGGTAVASFTLANNKTYMQNNEKKDSCSFFNCIAWGKMGETIAKHCLKGHRIGAEGRLQQRSWQDNNGQKRNTVEIVLENFQFLTSLPQQAGESQGSDTVMDHSADTSGQPSFDELPKTFSDEDIPY